ncbi:hypothetical protein TNCV_2130791 [Trichonephila clavipes]|nr:hypothetical protein TNCV_2130791 [Trichonephila clavipes]
MRGRRLLTNSRVLSLKTGVEPSEIVLSPAWCSKLRLTTGVHLTLYREEFRGHRSDTVRQVALATTAGLESRIGIGGGDKYRFLICYSKLVSLVMISHWRTSFEVFSPSSNAKDNPRFGSRSFRIKISPKANRGEGDGGEEGV